MHESTSIPATRTKSMRAKRRALWMVAACVALPSLALYGCFGGSDDPISPGVDTGTISGVVEEPQSGEPIVAAVVTITPVAVQKPAIRIAVSSTTTDASGQYTFLNVEVGTYLLTVDASSVDVDPSNPNLRFIGFAVEVTVQRGVPQIVDAPLPIVDSADSETVTPGQPTILEPQQIPGLRIEIAADAVTFPGGGSTGELNVVQLGFDQGPIPLAHGVAPSMMIKILPEGAAFNPPASIDFPNRDGVPNGGSVELFSYDATTHVWASNGRATSDGEMLSSNAGAGFNAASTHYFVCDATTLTGRIVDASQSPVAGAVVTAWASVDPFGHGDELVALETQANTDVNGQFAISGVRACNVAFAAVRDGATSFGVLEVSDAVAATPAGMTDFGTRTMNLVTETMFSLSGTVRSQDGTPMANAVVQYFDPASGPVPGSNTSTTSNANGAYTLEDLVGQPGREMGVYASVPNTDLNGEERFTVPALNQTGSMLQRDMRVCDWRLDVTLCGHWGTWSLSGNTLNVEFTEMQCGEAETHAEAVHVVSLVDGVLTIQFEEDGQTVTSTLTRVSETGPTGVSAANVVGLYRANFGEQDDIEFIGVLSGGALVVLETVGEGADAQAGTFATTSTQVTVTFRFNSEPGSTPGETATFDYTIVGKNLTIVNPEESEVFQRCDEGPQSGISGAWMKEHSATDALTLFFSGNEFVAVSSRTD